MKVLGIIPARGGSKGISKKNIRLVDGAPLITYSIKTAKTNTEINRLVVSTDDTEIRKISENFGCEVLVRSAENATDSANIVDVITEVLSQLNESFDLILLLQPTAPIRESDDISNVISMFHKDQDLECVVSVVKLDDIHPARMYSIDENENLTALDDTLESLRRQELPNVYLRNGSIYAIRTKTFLEHNRIITDKKKAYVMPISKWINIDNERDLIILESLIKLWKKGIL